MKLAPLPLALLFSSSLCAQIPTTPQLGPFRTTGVAFATAGYSNELQHFRADTQAVAPFEPMGPTGASYRVDDIFSSLSNEQRELVEIDAIATGNDVVPVTYAFGQFRMNPRRMPHGWSALFMSFRLCSVSPTGPMPMAERRAPGWAGGDVYSWIVPGSLPLGSFEDQIFVDVAAPSLGLASGQELVALDIPLAVLAQSGGTAVPNFAPVVGHFFFSLTNASAAALASALAPANAFPGVAPDDMSGATVFHTFWNGVGWSPITVAVHPYQLDLDGGTSSPLDDEDLDALAVEGATAMTVVYSVKKQPMSSPQLMTLTPSGQGELFTENGDPISTRIGDSDIDAICGIDPEMGTFSRWVGTPIATAPSPLILSATQMFSAPAPGQLVIVVSVSGSPAVNADLVQSAPLTLEVSATQDGDADSWLPFWVEPLWNGTGTWHVVLPLTFMLNVPVQLRAVLQPAGMAPMVSTSIGTIL